MEKNKKHKEDTEIENQVEARDFSADENNKREAEDGAYPRGPDETKQKLREELDEQKDKYVRLFAEFENFKRLHQL